MTVIVVLVLQAAGVGVLVSSVFPLVDEGKKLCKLPDGRGWLWGKTVSCSLGRVSAQ